MFCYFQFLTKKGDVRLGAQGNLGAIKSHPFFKNIDWGAVEGRQMEPPLRITEVSCTVLYSFPVISFY